MKGRPLLIWAAAAIALVGWNHELAAQSSSSSSSGSAVGAHASTGSGSTAGIASGSQQSASGSQASAGSGSDAFGIAGQSKQLGPGATFKSGSFAAGGASAWGFAKVGSDKDYPPGGGGGGTPGGGTGQACAVDITDWDLWRKLNPEIRNLVLGCECLIRRTPQPMLDPRAHKLCPVNSVEIFVAQIK